MFSALRSPRTILSLLAVAFLAIAGLNAARSPDLRSAHADMSASSRAVQPTGPTLTLVGHSDLGGQGFNADVAVLGQHAYVGSWGIIIPDGPAACPALGVHIVDLADPTAPRLVATAARIAGTSAEDPVAVRVSTPFFRGDLLAVGIQRCDEESEAPAGLVLVDVTDPRNPVDLGVFDTSPGPHGVDELDVVMRDERVLALLAVPVSEEEGVGDFRIVDITDPRRPVQLADWGARTRLGMARGHGCFSSPEDVFVHSARANADGTRAYLSNWDAGVIILDIADPAAPRFLGRAPADPTTEGSVHSVDEMAGGLLLVAEEIDTGPPVPISLRIGVQAGGATEQIFACEFLGPASLLETGVLTGALIDLGTACAVGAKQAAGTIAVAGLGERSVDEQARQAQAAGVQALIVPEAEPGEPPAPEGDEPFPLPVLVVSQEAGARLRALVAAGAVSVTLPSARPWGGLQIWDIRDPAKPVRRAVFHTENARRFPPPAPGIYTAHNPLSVGQHALVSWYSDGVVLLDLSDPARPRQVASFVPPTVADPQQSELLPPAPLVWGVAREGDLVLASDINGGLYVLRVAGIPLR